MVYGEVAGCYRMGLPGIVTPRRSWADEALVLDPVFQDSAALVFVFVVAVSGALGGGAAAGVGGCAADETRSFHRRSMMAASSR